MLSEKCLINKQLFTEFQKFFQVKGRILPMPPNGKNYLTQEKVQSRFHYFFPQFLLFIGPELNKEFPLAKFLSDANIVPGAVYQTEDILQAVKSQLNVSKMKILVFCNF